MNFIARVIKVTLYFFHFLKELFMANFQVVAFVLSPRLKFKSHAIRYKTNVKTQSELLLLTNSITLTPGTLVMDSFLKKGEILIHVMSNDSTDVTKKQIESALEEKVLWAMR